MLIDIPPFMIAHEPDDFGVFAFISAVNGFKGFLIKFIIFENGIIDDVAAHEDDVNILFFTKFQVIFEC